MRPRTVVSLMILSVFLLTVVFTVLLLFVPSLRFTRTQTACDTPAKMQRVSPHTVAAAVAAQNAGAATPPLSPFQHAERAAAVQDRGRGSGPASAQAHRLSRRRRRARLLTAVAAAYHRDSATSADRRVSSGCARCAPGPPNGHHGDRRADVWTQRHLPPHRDRSEPTCTCAWTWPVSLNHT
ncbi:uncharacterized protein LOC125940540 [Dermacentor silvarum]|uniref:uncharacterized protein LOC125940540 n=1 Tax=Dermacentor silvarum TaxID=543639 RepID=UPI002101B866|nr:uncharacterized protein LOC125940540 [Dermacentor silvarum]